MRKAVKYFVIKNLSCFFVLPQKPKGDKTI